MKKRKVSGILENIKWFKKFSLLERLKIAFEQQKSIKILRGLRIEGLKRSA